MDIRKINPFKPDELKNIGLSFSDKKKNKRRIYHLALFYVGFGSLISQMLLVREFLVSYYGNELSIGIVFACWLLWIAIGSLIGNRIVKRRQNIYKSYSIIIASSSIITFLQIIAVKFSHRIFSNIPGTFLSMSQLLEFAFISLSIGCFTWGLLFVVGANILSSQKTELWFGVNKAYILESIGGVAGGLLFSFILSSHLSSFQIVFLLGLLSWIIAIQIHLRSDRRSILIILAALLIYPFALPIINRLEHNINSLQWSITNRQLTFIRGVDTKYQNISLLRFGNQYTICTDGRPSYNIPNTYDAEIFTHSIMIHKANAKRVLILGGGFNGIIRELLKYRVNCVDYIEIDSSLISVADPILSEQDRLALHDKRVNIIIDDGRKYVRLTDNQYDVIIINTGEPSTANLNRYFTHEFYQHCKPQLTQNGILAFSFPSSNEYLSNELRDLNSSLYQTVKQSFDNILLIPGTHATLIATNSKHSLVSDPDSLAKRFALSGISCEYFTKYMFEDLLLPERIRSLTDLLNSIKNYQLNTDSNPVVYYFDLLIWNRLLEDDNVFLASITPLRIFIAEVICIVLVLLLLFLKRKRIETRNRTAIAMTITCSGIAGMALNLLFLLNFQVTFGSVYEMIGAMTASNMLGLAIGGMSAIKLMKCYNRKHLLYATLSSLLILVLLMPFLLNLLLKLHFALVTFLATMLGGGIIGMIFGIANRYYLNYSKNAGSIYAFEVIGSAFGALITCSILLPVLGINMMILFLLAMLIPIIAAVYSLRSNL
jgi:spermidine synthase